MKIFGAVIAIVTLLYVFISSVVDCSMTEYYRNRKSLYWFACLRLEGLFALIILICFSVFDKNVELGIEGAYSLCEMALGISLTLMCGAIVK